MTVQVNDQTPRDQYTATAAQTIFPYNFLIYVKGDVTVEQNGTALTVDTDYTVTGVENIAGGSVILTTGATSGDIVTVYRSQGFDRETDYQTSGDFLASTVNNDFNRIVLMLQQNREELSRSLQYSVDDIVGANALPDKATRANKALGFNSDGDPIVVLGTSSQDITLASAVSYFASGTGAVTTDVQTKLREFASVTDFAGVDPTGATDSTAGIQLAIDSFSTTEGDLFFPSGEYAFGDVDISASGIRIFGEEGATITAVGGASYTFRAVQGVDQVSFERLEFDGDFLAIQFASSGDTPSLVIDCNVQHCRFLNRAGNSIQFYDAPINCHIDNNRFDAGADWSAGDYAAVRVSLGTTDLRGQNTSLFVKENHCRGYDTLFRSEGTSGYFSGVSFTDNILHDCGQGVRVYHVDQASVVNNKFFRCIGAAYLWRSWNTHHNQWEECGDGTDVVVIEAMQGNFQSNTLRANLGDNLVIDGGASQGIVDGNFFQEVDKNPIRVEPDHSYNNDIDSLTISNNKMQDFQRNGIHVVTAASDVRRLHITDNKFLAGGQASGTYANVYIAGSGAISDLEVIDNTFVRNDGTTAGGLSGIDHDVYFDNASLTMSGVQLVTNNRCDNAGVDTVERAAATGVIIERNNYRDGRLEEGTHWYVGGTMNETAQGMPKRTTSQLADVSDIVNTDSSKVVGYAAFNLTTQKPVYAAGNSDASVWLDATGATAHSPV